MLSSRPSVRRTLRAALLCIALMPLAAHADNAAAISKAEQAYAQLDYASANAAAKSAITAGGLNHDELTRATRVVALTSVALERPTEAKDAFALLLTYDPTYTVDAKLGPRYREPFNEAKGYWAAQSSKPGMESSEMLSARAPGSIRVVTRDPTGVVARVVVAYRWAPAKNFVQVASKTGDQHIDVPAPPVGSSRLDYFVRAEDAHANAIFENGTSASPKFGLVNPEPATSTAKENKSVFASPWFWVVAGALIVAGGTTAGVLAFTQGGGTTTVVSKTWTPSLGCGGARCE